MLASEAYWLVKRLDLTGRYMLVGLPSLEEQRVIEAQSKRDSASSAAKGWQQQTNFRTNPPSPTLLEETLDLLQLMSEHECTSASSDHTSLASAVRTLLDDRAQDGAPYEYLSTNMQAVGNGLASSDCSSGSSETSSWIVLSHFISRLLQQSHGAWEAGESFRAARSSHMAMGAELQNHEAPKSVKSLNSNLCLQAAKDGIDLANSGDFKVVCLGSVTGISVSGQDRRSTAALLRLRLMLRSEPFFVRCSGAAHMDTFLQLAMLAGLHLQLLPSVFQIRHILK